jgi:hypothetical protein
MKAIVRTAYRLCADEVDFPKASMEGVPDLM